MDQIKIGKFIAQRRKEKSLTQLQLAEKLGVTDRAVSKWENGKAMPDSSLMMELCGALEITVNDLLSGEIVSSEDYAQKLEEKLMETLDEKERSDKMLYRLNVTVGIFAIALELGSFIIDIIFYTWWSLIVVHLCCAFAIVYSFILLKIDRAAGYYRCKKCNTTYKPTAKALRWSFIRMRCPHCNKRTRHKKVFRKD